MARSTERIAEASTIRSRRVGIKYAVTRRPHDFRDEHSSALHESAEQSYTRASREQQLLFH